MENNTRVIIICAGEATRWKDHLGVPKHLIPIDGEPLLNRTVRLLRHFHISDITVVSKDDPRYKIEGAKQFVATLNYEENADADKFLSSRELWNDQGRTIVLYGDVFFSLEALNTIINSKETDWTLFCRPDASRITGHKWGECFAISFYPESHNEMTVQLRRTATLWKAGKISRCGGWELYRAMTGRPDDKIRHPHLMTTNFVKIDDFTEDFDSPEDYELWIARWKRKV